MVILHLSITHSPERPQGSFVKTMASPKIVKFSFLVVGSVKTIDLLLQSMQLRNDRLWLVSLAGSGLPMKPRHQSHQAAHLKLHACILFCFRNFSSRLALQPGCRPSIIRFLVGSYETGLVHQKERSRVMCSAGRT